MMKKYILFLIIFFLFTLRSKTQTVTDIDGNIYNAITIGTQTWMKENLKSTHFNNGDLIPTTTLPVQVDSASLYQWPYNDDSNNINIYGRLYTWYSVVNNNNVCPTGWHVPSDSEWIKLSNFLGGDSVAGGKLKEPGIMHWSVTDSTVDNSSFFTGLPGGFRGNPSGFLNIASLGIFWSATPWGSAAFQRALCYSLQSNDSRLASSVAIANCGLSVRCLKNLPIGTGDIQFNNGILMLPNPANDKITISFEEPGNRTLLVYNMPGSIIIQMNLTNKVNLIDIGALVKGTYIIRIVETDRITERKLIKE